MKVTIEFEDFLRKEVKEIGASGHAYLPKSWIGKNIIVILPSKDLHEVK